MVKVSVIIPIYNKEEYLEKTIASVLEQDFEDYEVLLVDDGSTDKSSEIALSYVSHDKRIKYFYHENIGVSETRNKGIKLAQGEFISFLDADDILMPNFLKKMYDKVKNINTVYCGTYIIIDQEFVEREITFKSGSIVAEYLKNKTKPPTNCWMIRKSFLEEYHIEYPAGLSWGEDSTFFIQILIHDNNVSYVNEYLTAYNRDVEGNLSVDTLDKIDEDLEWLEIVIDYITDRIDDEEKRNKYIRIIETYNIPGTILYRINSNMRQMKKDEVKTLISKYKKYINFIPISNGLRSVKMILLKYIVLVKMQFLTNH